jgi:chorismate synthase
MSNTFGTLFRLTTFGESHGPCIGGVIDGCPSGVTIDRAALQHQLDRRRGGQSSGATPRQEEDQVEFLSGLLEDRTTGAPIAFLLRNKDTRSSDYDPLKDLFRPSHADYTLYRRYGLRDYRGGGRASARETAARVVAGALAEQILRERCGIEIVSFTSRLGPVSMTSETEQAEGLISYATVEGSTCGCPDAATDEQMREALDDIVKSGDSLGGIATTIVRQVPAGWGDPIYDKLSARLASAMMSINAAKGFEIGDGFRLASMRGSETNDPFTTDDEGSIHTITNHSGGIQGGISNGEAIIFRTAFKPISSIALPQQTVDRDGRPYELVVTGRHDRTVFPRVLPVVDAMTALVLMDEYLTLYGTRSLSVR